jgi:ABC-type bacteriocin/lantibiotic exporter with double-glycine peptidase domain
MMRDLLAQAETQSYLVEAIRGIATLKASGTESSAFDHWSNLFVQHLNVSSQRMHLAAIVNTLLTAFRSFAPLLLLWVGAQYVLEGRMSLGTMLGLNALAAACLMPLASLVSSIQSLQLVSAHLERMTDIIETEPEQSDVAIKQTAPLAGRIELRHVSFRYDPQAPWVLRDISLTIEQGQKLVLVGRTGSGKSTLAMLLLGLYPPTEGTILYDGIPLLQQNYQALRSQFGVVLQDPFLFSGSIRQNIAFGAPASMLEQIIEAAQFAAIHDDIMQMPMGYETQVAEGGSGLSGGQIQRITIARALVRKPAILVLDEATSHLDAATEHIVDQNLSQLACTRIVIAHRLSTIRNADRILVLDGGAIVEQGTHEDLLELGSVYTAMVNGQTSNVG